MQGSLNDVLPEPVSPEVADAFRDLVKGKLKGCASMLVTVVRALEAKYGPEVMRVAGEAISASRKPRPADQLKSPEEDLADFCAGLERGCWCHGWEKVVDTPTRQGYRFTRCLWADIFRELGATDIGWWWCGGDEPSARNYTPALGFERTKTLMDGESECDHVFKVER